MTEKEHNVESIPFTGQKVFLWECKCLMVRKKNKNRMDDT